jgi:tetratricopeptide (TPR) repeat protein
VLALALLGRAALAEAPATVPAGTAVAPATADEWFAKATVHYNLGEYEAALAAYREAYRRRPDPIQLYNFALCSEALGHRVDALRWYRMYLEQDPETPIRAEVERRIALLDAPLPAATGGAAAPVAAAPPTAAPATAPRGTHRRSWAPLAIAAIAVAVVAGGVAVTLALTIPHYADTELGPVRF